MSIEPMTAAEYREWCNSGLGVNGDRVLAALEERERLLERVAELEGTIRSWQPSADAALGALVRRIREHPMADDLAFRVSAKPDPIHFYYKWQESALVEALDRLDSLLPKEPEVVVKLGGRTWTFGTSPVGNTNVWWRPGDGTSYVTASGELELALNALNALGGGK